MFGQGNVIKSNYIVDMKTNIESAIKRKKNSKMRDLRPLLGFLVSSKEKCAVLSKNTGVARLKKNVIICHHVTR